MSEGKGFENPKCPSYRVHYIDSETWPEKCILNMFNSIDKSDFAEENRVDIDSLDSYIDEITL